METKLHTKVLAYVTGWLVISTLLLGLYGWRIAYRTQIEGSLECFSAMTGSSGDQAAWDLPKSGKKK